MAGTLNLGHDASGSGTYNLNGGVLAISGLGAGSGTATFDFGGGTLQANTAFTASLPMTLTGTGGDANVNTAGHAVTLAGDFRAGGLTRRARAGLTLNGANTYTGTTTVQVGHCRSMPTTTTTNVLSNAGGVDVTGGFYWSWTIVPAGPCRQHGSKHVPRGLQQRRQRLPKNGQIRDALATGTAGLGLGWVDNATTHQVTIMPALYGDCTLDGVVGPAN